jgi:hypothetical protein
MTAWITGAPCGGSATAAALLALRSPSSPLQELDEEVLVHLGGSWDQPPVLDSGWENDASLDPLRSRAAKLLDEVLGPASSRDRAAGWEDARLALLLPFWQTVTSIDTTVVIVRDPAEVAASLLGRYGIDPPEAALLWLRYMLSATAHDPGCLLIPYGELVANPSATLAELARRLDTPVPDRIEASGSEHLDPLRSNDLAVAPSWDVDNPLVALAATVWNEGALDLTPVPTIVGEGIRRGRLRPAADGEVFARARAQVMSLRDRVRRLHREHATLATLTTKEKGER